MHFRLHVTCCHVVTLRVVSPWRTVMNMNMFKIYGSTITPFFVTAKSDKCKCKCIWLWLWTTFTDVPQFQIIVTAKGDKCKCISLWMWIWMHIITLTQQRWHKTIKGFSFSTLTHTKKMTTSISNAYQATNIHLNNIIPLDFVSVLQLPESHVWTDDDDSGKDRRTCLVRQPRAVAASPPVIDLQAPDAVGLVGDACRTWGVFQVTNHGVPHDLLEGVEDHVRRLFELPNDQKLKALRAPNGVTGYGVPRFSPFFPKLMWHEGFTIAGSPMEHAKLLWPHHYEEFWYVLALLLYLYTLSIPKEYTLWVARILMQNWESKREVERKSN